MDPVVFVHLSDIHFTSSDNGLAVRRDAVRLDVLNDLRAMRPLVGDATAVVVTGDIAFAAKPEEYALAQSWLDEVAAVVGTDRAQVLTVPGNHDVDRGSMGRVIELAHEQLRRCPVESLDHELDALLEDPDGLLLRPLMNYNKFALRYGCSVPANGRAWELEPIDLRPGRALVIRGLTSVFNSDRHDSDGQLIVGRTQTALPALPGTVYMLLVHHGPDDCRDPVGFRDRIKDRAVLLLSGHRHDQRVRDVDGHVELNAGAVHPEEQVGYNPTYNWIRLSVDGDHGDAALVVEVWERELRPEWNEFRSRTGSDACRTFRLALPRPAPLAPASAGATDGGGGASAAAPALAGQEASQPAPGPAGDGAGEQGFLESTGEGADQADDTVGPDATAERRAGLEDATGEVDQERRVWSSLMDLAPPAQFAVLDDCGLLAPEDWTKEYLTMITDAVGLARERGALGELETAVSRKGARA